MKKFNLLLCLLSVLLVFATACSGGNGSGGGSTTGGTSGGTEASTGTGGAEASTDTGASETTQTESLAVNGASGGIYPDPSNPVNLSFFADCTWLPYDNLDGITGQEVERLTGVSFDFTKATDSEQLILLMSSNDLPDLVMASSTSKLSRLSNPEYCYSFNELIEQYAPDWVIPEAEKKLNAYYSEDGNFYMLKNEFNTVEEIRAFDKIGPNFGQLHYRKDIYDAVGAPPITDKQSFLNLLGTVKENYPDMQPVVFNPRELGGFTQFAGLDPVFPTDVNGNFCYFISDPQYKEFARLFYEMHKAGYITAENFTYDTDEQVFQGTITGKTFLVSHYAGNDEQMFTSNVQTTIPEASFVQMPLTPNWKQTIGVSGWAACFITKNCKDPETAIKFLRWAKEPKNQIVTMMGVEGEDWEENSDGTFTTLPRYNEAFEAGRYDSDYKQIGFLVSATDYIRESIKFYTVATPATKEIFSDAVKRANWSTCINLAWPKADTDENVILSNLSTLDTEYFALMATAPDDATFEALYDEMMAEAEKIGLAQANAALSQLYSDLCDLMGTK